MLPSLRQLAKDLRISVLTTTRAYNELEQEGFITSRQGKGFFVMSSSSNLIREQLIKEVEKNLNCAIQAAERASMSNDEIISLLILSISVDTFNSKICGTYAAASRAAKYLCRFTTGGRPSLAEQIRRRFQ